MKLKEKMMKDGSWRKVAIGKITSGIGDTTALDLLIQEAGDSGGVGGLTDHL